jgi:hypothetical protein
MAKLRFRGIVPRLVTKESMAHLPPHGQRLYSMKYDGERATLLWNKHNGLTFLNRASEMDRVLPAANGLFQYADPFFIDCEICENGALVIVLDAQCSTMPVGHFRDLRARLNWFDWNLRPELARALRAERGMELHIKKFYDSVSHMLAQERVERVSYDGYIITSVDGGAIYKLKTKQTVDFGVGPGGVAADGTVVCPTINYGFRGIGPYKDGPVTHCPPGGLVMEGDIVECETVDGFTYTFVKVRVDKKIPNYINVLNDIRDHFRAPVLIADL